MPSGRAAWAAYAAELAAITLVYWAVASLSLSFASINPSATPIWPPTGIALGLTLLRGSRIWPAILVGAIAVNFPTTGSTALAIGAGNTLEALVGAWLVRALAGGVQAFRSPVGVAKFAAAVCAVATPISATVGVLALTLAGHAQVSSFAAVWTTWWLGDLAGALVVAPAVVLWAIDRPRPRFAAPISTAALAVAVGFVALGPGPWPVGAAPLAFLAVLPLLWGALRGSERDTATAAVILSGFAVWGAAAGAGPFLQPTVNDSFLLLVAFIVSAATPSLALSAGMGVRSRALKQSEQNHRLLVEAIRDYAIFMIDADGRVATWNIGAARIYGHAEAEIVGRPVTDLLPEDGGADIRALLDRVAETEAAEDEGWRLRRDGSRFWAHVQLSAMRDERGRLVGFAKITRDVSEQRQAQSALERTREQLLQAQKLEALGQLTGGVAHDFNNLLMVVSGQADLLSRRLRAEAELRSLDAIKAAVTRGASLTRQLLSFARRQNLTPEAIDVPRRLEAMRGVLKSSLGEAVELELDFDETAWPVEADADELELALLNLAVNARDAMPDGGRVRISVRNAPGGQVEISVGDTGVGMTPEVLARAFDPFFTTKPTGKGTGLGLSQVHGFALQSGGDVAAVSLPGEGCKVTLRLPRATASREGADVPAAGGDGRRPSARPPQLAAAAVVLLVEDNPDVFEATAGMLEQLGCRVVPAVNGALALRQLEGGERVDVVLSDIVMPGPIDGLALAERLRTLRPDLPVVLTTGYSKAAEAAPPGVQILRKPFELEVLAAALAAATPLPAPAGAAEKA